MAVPPTFLTLDQSNVFDEIGYAQVLTVNGTGDTVQASAGNCTVQGVSGTLTFIGGGYACEATQQNGTLIASTGNGGGILFGGAAGHNVLVANEAAGGNATLKGGGAGDALYGAAGGNDVINLGSGTETVVGGGGSTSVNGGDGYGVIFTGGGNTTVGGSVYGDTIVGGSGADTINTRGGEAVFAGSGSTLVNAYGPSPDSIIGGSGALVVNGVGANMLVQASTALSNINTGSGAALSFSLAGFDQITGGSGSLQVVLGKGQTNVTEGAGPSIYDEINGTSGGVGNITRFQAGKDQIDAFGYTPGSASITTAGSTTTIAFTDGSKIVLADVANFGQSSIHYG